MTSTLDTYLRAVSDILRKVAHPNGGTAGLVEVYGTTYRSAPLPAGVERGAPQMCYSNAAHLSLDDPALTYCEGFAESAAIPGLGFAHAWCVTDDGTVVDPTWDDPEHAVYRGIAIDRTLLLSTALRTGYYGVLDSLAAATTTTLTTTSRGGLIIVCLPEEGSPR